MSRQGEVVGGRLSLLFGQGGGVVATTISVVGLLDGVAEALSGGFIGLTGGIEGHAFDDSSLTEVRRRGIGLI